MSERDIRAIGSLVYSYPRLIDDGDFDAVADLFQHARVIAGDGTVFQGREVLRELWASGVRLHEDGTPRTQHVVTNLDITHAEGADTATASSYVTVLQACPGLPLQVIAASRHDDVFERVDGAWRFAERRDRQRLVGDLSHHFAPPPASA
ncbi:nuclear transport factor 2 family protein [Frankia nepalensis]|uniref:Nuclear transport factor 2 family protein n=1 Tax=Frankia nepalensis TaxID=1836974 RepID=A0A937US96_9ACTN|nr:nuclear transport factor 2 family protein [Frankia nepalensis]MBL7630045.1 nuclear transport factor 2 family protein [Frankia nepalensis]